MSSHDCVWGSGRYLALLSTNFPSRVETLVVPLKHNDAVLINAFERALTAAEIQLVPITHNLLREAAQLRAQYNLKTPDAIHAATALRVGCAQLITNDSIFRRVLGLNVVVLYELI